MITDTPRPSVLARLQNVTFSYPGHTSALFSGVTLDLRAGEIAVLAGANGTGKSTILQLLCGRIHPLRGSVEVFGADPSRADRLPDVGIVTEPFHPDQSPLPVELCARELLDWLEILDGVSRPEADSLADRLQIAGRLWSRPIRRLSKGERQRVQLWAVLLRRPRLILADEPLEGLDPLSRQLITEALATAARSGGAGILWVSHHLSETIVIADRLLELVRGELTERRERPFRVSLSDADGGARCAELFTLEGLAGLTRTALEKSERITIEVQRCSME